MIRLTVALALSLLASIAPAAAAQVSMATVLRSVYALHAYGGVELSPSGDAVAWDDGFHPGPAPEKARASSALYVQRLSANAPATRVTAGKAGAFSDEGDATWAPDGKHLAFLSNARSRAQDQLFVADGNGANVRQLGQFDGNVQSAVWSPAGTSIAVLYIAQAHRKAGALAAGARDVGVIGAVVDEQRLTLVDAKTGALQTLTPADTYVYEYGWSPDGKHLAVTYARGNGDDNWWVAKLATVDARTGAMHDLLAPSYQIDDPQWSPDGKQIALIGGLMSDFGSTGGDVYLVDAATGAARDATPNMVASAASLRWASATTLDFAAHVNGAMQLMSLDTSGGVLTALTHEPESIWSWSVAKGNVFALARQSFDHPSAVWAGTIGGLKALTHGNDGAPRYYGKTQSLSWKSDAFTVQGWLIYPLDYDPAKTYPMVAIVHGGPSSQSVPTYGNRNISALASRGYFIFEPNFRGSYGQGEAFTAANVKDFGYGDWRDDLLGLDAALKAAPIDPNRLGLFGWSYGGYMAMWAETQTTRFKAIVAGAGIVSWQSYYGQNKIDQWMLPFFGASVYDDPAVYAKSSPITFIKASKTPVLILQGERDEEVPAPQAFEFWHAMQALGVPTQLRVYADEGHAPQRAEDQIDILTRMVGWFDKYLGGVTRVRVLILGGTAFLGIHLTNDLLARGYDVTHFNRGRTGTAPAVVRTIHGDRAAGFDGLEDERFDAVVDTSGYLPHVVEKSARFFEPRCARYMFVSSISVYDDKVEEGFEDSPMAALSPEASLTEMTPETYGPLKAACERIVASTFRERSTVVRPGLIVGPYDRTDRFTYWPVRFARGGEILAPGEPEAPVQFVDARDLAAFMVRLLERNVGGDFNVTSPQGAFTMGGVMDACAEAARVPRTVRWVEHESLTGQGVAPWMDLPLWIPPSENMPGFMNYNVGRALAAGLTIRPIAETVRDTLSWALARPRDHIARAGITAEREAELLAL